MLQAIIFDFDGVIADSERLHLRAYQEVLGPEGIELSERDYYDRYLGYDDVGVLRELGKDRGVPMNQVRIAELKAKLGEYLRAVRRGETIAVFDRETPVAQIVPVRAPSTLRVRKPAAGTPPPKRIPLPKPVKLPLDVVQLLLEERQGQR